MDRGILILKPRTAIIKGKERCLTISSLIRLLEWDRVK